MALRRVTTHTSIHTHTYIQKFRKSEDECELFLILYINTYKHTYIDNLCKSNKCKIKTATKQQWYNLVL